MKINNKEIKIEELVNKIKFEENFTKHRKGNIYLSDYQINILRKYDINYENFSNITSLLLAIEEVLNNDFDENMFDLEEISAYLAQMNYYNNTTK